MLSSCRFISSNSIENLPEGVFSNLLRLNYLYVRHKIVLEQLCIKAITTLNSNVADLSSPKIDVQQHPKFWTRKVEIVWTFCCVSLTIAGRTVKLFKILSQQVQIFIFLWSLKRNSTRFPELYVGKRRACVMYANCTINIYYITDHHSHIWHVQFHIFVFQGYITNSHNDHLPASLTAQLIRALHLYRKVMDSSPVQTGIFSCFFFRNCFSCVLYYDDLSILCWLCCTQIGGKAPTD